MTRREDEMRERIYSLEGQLVKAAVMVTEARERAEEAEMRYQTYYKFAERNLKRLEGRAEAAEKERDNLGDSLRNYAKLERLAQERAEAAEKALQAVIDLPSVDGLNEAERTRQELRLIEQARQIARTALEAKP